MALSRFIHNNRSRVWLLKIYKFHPSMFCKSSNGVIYYPFRILRFVTFRSKCPRNASVAPTFWVLINLLLVWVLVCLRHPRKRIKNFLLSFLNTYQVFFSIFPYFWYSLLMFLKLSWKEIFITITLVSMNEGRFIREELKAKAKLIRFRSILTIEDQKYC